MENNFISRNFFIVFTIILIIILGYVLFQIEIKEQELKDVLSFRNIRLHR